MVNASSDSGSHAGLSFTAFVAMMACFMALNGLAVDTMLPALPAIGSDLGVTDENARQWIITAYLLGFGIFQLVYGPLSDRYGRKPVLLAGVLLYAFFSLITALAQSFDTVVFARFMQGAGSAASRVLVIAIVRDCYSGRRMARVMSLAFMIFLIVPILAPAIGQGVMLVTSWHFIFVGLTLIASFLSVWVWKCLPESLSVDKRLPLSPQRVMSAFKVVVTTRQSIGYCLGMTLVLGPLYGYLVSVQQIFADVFDTGGVFVIYFAVTALSMAMASFLNSRIVEQFGTRLVSHWALCGMLATSCVGLLLVFTQFESLGSFVVLLSAMLFFFGFTAPNFGAMAMETVGHIAGTASSVQGCITTVGAALLGYLIGHLYDGTTVPLLLSFGLLSAAALGVVYKTEGRLFKPLHEPPENQV